MSLFTKVWDLANVSLDNLIIKASGAKNSRKSMAVRERSSYEQDPYNHFQDQGWRERYTALDFNMLKRMAQNSIVASIIQTRAMQAQTFCRPQKSKYDTGYAIRLRDANAEMTDETNQEIESICEYLKFTGIQDDTRPFEECDTFETFVYKLVQDRYTYDQVALEFIKTMDGRLHHWVTVDAGTIRLASSKLKDQQENFRGHLAIANSPLANLDEDALEEIKYVQVFRGRIVEAFTSDELLLKFGNPTADIRANGYSVGELERLVNIITSHIHTENHNKLQFTHGQAQKGILHIKGEVRQAQLESFRRHFHHQTTGNNNAWRTPILAATDDVKWISLQNSNRDMEFTQWMNYLIKVICSLFQIDPEEINFGDAKFKSGGTGGVAFLSGNEKRIKHSQDRGLRPLLRFIEGIINDVIFKQQGWSDKYVFEFVGLNAETLAEAVERQNKEVQFYKTIDEIRQEQGLDPLNAEKGGHIIQNPNYIQWITQFGKDEMKMKQENAEAFMNMEQDSNEDGNVEDMIEDKDDPKQKDSKKPAAEDKEEDTKKSEEELQKSYNIITIKV